MSEPRRPARKSPRGYQRSPASSLLIVLPLMSGCVFPAGYSERLTFSPSGEYIVWVQADVLRAVHPLPPRACQGCMFPSLAQAVYVRWRSVASPGEHYSWKAHTLGADDGSHRYASMSVNLVFSPYAPRLAVATPQRVTIIDLKSGRHWRATPDGEQITSLAWLSENEIAYVVHGYKQDDNNAVLERAFWRHNVGDAPVVRRPILSERQEVGSPYYAPDWGVEHWSPRGRYVIFWDWDREGQLRFMEVPTTEVKSLPATDAWGAGVSWRPDDSAALCVCGRFETSRAFVVYTVDGHTLDITIPLAETFPRCPGPCVEPLATADGQYFVINDSGGHLIRPKPWQDIPLGQVFKDHTGLKNLAWARIYPTPLPGWVIGYGPGVPECLISYDGSTVVSLGQNHPAISPDGKLTATIDWLGGVTLQKLVLLESRPAN